jgi:DNA-directed RNA polymerase specialized sigma24 family protein
MATKNSDLYGELSADLSEENIRQIKSLIPPEGAVSSSVLSRLRDGDHESFKTVYLHWRQPILRLVSGLTGSDAEADDITQDIFAALWYHREQIDPERNLRSFLFLVARRTAYKSIRSQQVRDRYADSLWPDEHD